MEFDSLHNIIRKAIVFALFILLWGLIVYVIRRIFSKKEREMDEISKGKVLKYHLCKALDLIKEGMGESWYQRDPDIILALGTVAGAFLNSKSRSTDSELQKRVWKERQAVIERISICPCCLRTFHEVVIKGKPTKIVFPPGIFEKVTKYLSSDQTQKALAISLLMISLDIKIQEAKEIVKNWHKIKK